MTSIVEPKLSNHLLCRFCMSALGWFSFKHRPNKKLHIILCILQYLEVKRILLLTIACLCHKGIHMPSLCAFYGNVLRKILPNKRRCSRRAHTGSTVNTPLVTEQMTESVHIPPACGCLEKVSLEKHFLFINFHMHVSSCVWKNTLFINSYTHIQVCVCIYID